VKKTSLAAVILLMGSCRQSEPVSTTAAAVPPVEIGRYQVVWNPGQVGGVPQMGIEERALLIDTVTGRVWRYEKWSDMPRPGWVLMERIDAVPPVELPSSSPSR